MGGRTGANDDDIFDGWRRHRGYCELGQNSEVIEMRIAVFGRFRRRIDNSDLTDVSGNSNKVLARWNVEMVSDKARLAPSLPVDHGG